MVQLHQHQEEAVTKLGNGKVLWGGVGTGKSITAAAYYVRNETPRDIYVITTAKKRNSLDWEKEFAAFAISKNPEATFAGVLTVDSWNNIGRYTDVNDAFFIFDEQRAVGSGAWADALIKIAKRNRWIMLSATPGDGWLDYIPLFVANGFYKNRTAFLREHAVFNRFAKYPKVDRFMGESKLVRYKQELLVEMPYTRHTRRIVSEVSLEHDSEALERVFKDRWNIFEEKPLRDIAELFTVARKVVNSDRSRLAFVRSLLTRHPRLIVFYNFDYELEMLRTLASSSTSTESRRTSTGDEGSSTTSSTKSLSTQKKSETRSSSTATSTSSSGRSCHGTDVGPTTTPVSASCETDRSSTRRPEWTSEQIPTPASTESSRPSPTSEEGSDTAAQAAASSSTTRSSMAGCGSTSPCTEPGSRSEQAPGGCECQRSVASTTDTSSEPSRSSRRTDTAPSTTSGLGQMWNHNHQDPIAHARVVVSESGVHWEMDSPLGSSSGLSTSSAEDSSKPSSPERAEPASFALAEWNGHKHQEVPETDSWVYLVQYTAGSEGWNCTTTDALVFWSLTYSYKAWHQSFGRIDRLNTPFTELHYYVLQSNSWIDQAVRKSLAQKKNFNENRYSMKALESAA